MKKYIFYILTIMLTAANAQNITNDSTFNVKDNGSFLYVPSMTGQFTVHAIQPDGKMIVYINLFYEAKYAQHTIYRLNPNGTLDTTFNTSINITGYVVDMALQSDGKIVAVGQFTEINGENFNNIVRFNADGTIDHSFHYHSGFDNIIKDLIVQSNDKITIIGHFSTYNDTIANKIIRLNPNGSIDPTFNSGLGFNSTPFAMAVQNDGGIVVVGHFTSYNGYYSNHIIRLLDNGQVDNSFSTGTGFNIDPMAIDISSDNLICVAGYFSTYNDQNCNRVVCINSDGTYNSTFSAGSGPNNDIIDIKWYSNDKILITGLFSQYNGSPKRGIARLNLDGTLDQTFQTGYGVFGSPKILLQNNNKIILSNSISSFNTQVINNIVRINEDGSLDESLFNPGSGLNDMVDALKVLDNGKILLVGSFKYNNQVKMNYIGRLLPSGEVDSTFNTGTGPEGSVYAMSIQNDDKIIIGGNFTKFNNVPAKYLARISPNGNLDTTFNIGTGFSTYAVYAIAIQADGKILVGGSFNSFNGVESKKIVRLNPNGSIDTSFHYGTGFNYTVFTITVQADQKIIIGGDFDSYNGTSISSLVRLNPDGSIDNTFNIGSGFQGLIYATTIDANNKILVGGKKSNYNSNSNYQGALFRLNTDGSLDDSFEIGKVVSYTDDKVMTIVVEENDKILIGGWFNLYNSQPTKHFTRLNPDGTIDNTFNIGVGPDSSVYAIGVQPDHKIIIAGKFSKYDNIWRNKIARLVDHTFTQTEFVDLEEKYRVFPNPTSSLLNIQFNEPSNKNYIVELYNSVGILILRNEHYGSDLNLQLDVSEFKPGVYFVKVNGLTRKWIKA